MRFKSRLAITLLLLSAVFILLLAIAQDLDLYVHPRYIVFTYVMAAIGFAFIVLRILLSGPATSDKLTIGLVPLIIVLVTAWLLPARSLSSATVSQRAVSSGGAITTTDSQPLANLFAQSSRALGLGDWSRLIATNTDEAYYANKPAKISGFVYDAELGSDTVWLARFVLTCCAVDAQPIGVPVQIENWQSSYEQDQWLEVEGQFEKRSTAQGETLVLVPTSVSEIEEPNQPYVN